MAGTKFKEVRKHRTKMGLLGFDVVESTLFAACMDGVYSVDIESGKSRKLYEHESFASGAAVVSRLNQLVTAGYDGKLRWFDLKEEKVIRTVDAHSFWSWKMKLSADGRYLASSSGQYLAGGYKYEPAASDERTVKVYDAETGDLYAGFAMTGPVQCVAFSPDSKFVAAGNLMGDLKIWSIESKEEIASWNTPAFTSWGIIKSHCYIGGIFDVAFTADSQRLLATGMGPMRDPMAGNGKQLWQRFRWENGTGHQVDQTKDGESGEGLMESVVVSPDGSQFVIAGRLRGGDWNAAVFNTEDGSRIAHFKTGCRITQAKYLDHGQRLVLAGMQGQPRSKKTNDAGFGRIDFFEVQ